MRIKSIAQKSVSNPVFYDVCEVTVTEKDLVTSVKVNPPSLSLTVGETDVLQEIVCPENAANKTVKWRSENENVVIVNETSGKITAVSEGSTKEIDSNFSGEI